MCHMLIALLTGCGPPPFELTVTFDGDTTDTELQLFVGDTFLQAWPIDGDSITVTLPDGGGVGLLAADPPSAQLYAVRDDGVFVGAMDEWLDWAPVRDPNHGGGEEFGRTRGWNVVESFSSFTARIDTDILAMTLDLAPVPSARIGGPVDDTDGRLALAPLNWLEGGQAPATLLLDTALVDPWSAEVAGAPPDDHLGVVQGARASDFIVSLTGALEVPLRYTDLDGDGAFSEADRVDAYGCEALAWIPPATDRDAAGDAFRAELGTGWHTARLRYGEAALAPEAETGAELAAACEALWL